MTLFSAISPLPFFPYSCSIYTCVSFSFRKKFNISRPLSLLLLPNSRVWLTHKNIPRILMHNMTRMIFIFPNCLPILPTLANSTILPLTKSKYWGENVLTPLLSLSLFLSVSLPFSLSLPSALSLPLSFFNAGYNDLKYLDHIMLRR